MTNNELIRYIKKHGCKFLEHGGSHDVYTNPKTNGKVRILRRGTQEVKAGTLNDILSDLGLK